MKLFANLWKIALHVTVLTKFATSSGDDDSSIIEIGNIAELDE